MSIGMWDSGVGGLTVMREIKKALPTEKIIYFGDTARVPYGGRGSETIIRYSIENSKFLMQHPLKILIIACNTACSYAYETIQSISPVPVVGIIEPAARKAVEVTKNGRIAILGTKATIHSQVYQKIIDSLLPDAVLFPVACPLFVPLVEERFLAHAASELIVKEYLAKIKQEQVDTVVLGCTHYPILEHLIVKELGNDVHIVDSAKTCAETVRKRFMDIAPTLVLNNEKDFFFCSDDPEKFRDIGQTLLGYSIEQVQHVHSAI